MRFLFDERKSAQAAANLLRRNGGTMNYLKLMKLLYLADRQSFLETGYPITGARMVSMDKGPVLSEVYSCITWQPQAPTAWSEYVASPEKYVVSLAGATDDAELSDYERELLGRVWDTFGAMDQWSLVRYTHDLPEWADPDGSATPIDARVILQEAGRSDAEIQAVAEQVESIRAFRKMLA